MTDSFDVFLSHSSADKPLVEALARQLRRAGVRVWLDKHELRAGDRWLPVIEEAMRVAPAIAICFGKHGQGRVHAREEEIAHNLSMDGEGKRVFAVYLPGAPEDLAVSEWLRTSTWVDYRDQLPAKSEDLRRDFLPVDAARVGEPVDAGKCPYRGLEPFREEHAESFYGREAATQELLDATRAAAGRECRLVTVVGASGSGKSSLVRAGLVPAVRTGELDGHDREWLVATLLPGHDPCDALARELVRVKCWLADGPLTEARQDEEHEALSQRLREKPGVLARTVDRLLTEMDGAPRLLLVIDQLEEAFTLPAAEEGAASARAFLDNVVTAASAPNGPVHVVGTLRADFLGRCMNGHEGLALNLKPGLVLIPRMNDEELRAAIEEPARHAGLPVDEGLDDALIAEVRRAPGNLPLLQFALVELWEKRDKHGGRLAAAALEQLGGLEGALSSHADTVLAKLAPSGSAEEAVSRDIFLRLVQLGQGTEDTRRRVARAELVGLDANLAPKILDDPKDGLVQKRLLTADAAGGDAAHDTPATYEVAHEALIRSWKNLQEWLKDDREAQLLRQDVAQAADRWREAEPAEKPHELWSGGRLQNALDRLDEGTLKLVPQEEEFLEAGRFAMRALERGRRKRRALAFASLLILAFGATALAIFSGQLAVTAQENLADAERIGDLGTLREMQQEAEELFQMGIAIEERGFAPIEGGYEDMAAKNRALDEYGGQVERALEGWRTQWEQILDREAAHRAAQEAAEEGGFRALLDDLLARIALVRDGVTASTANDVAEFRRIDRALLLLHSVLGDEERKCWAAAQRDYGHMAHYSSCRDSEAMRSLRPQLGLVPLPPPDVSPDEWFSAGWDPGKRKTLLEFTHVLTGIAPASIESRMGPKGEPVSWVEVKPETGATFVLVPTGSFQMGSSASDSEDERPVREVSVPRPLLVGKHELTQAQWLRLRGLPNPSEFDEMRVDDNGVHPVENVTWIECRDTLASAGLRLPSEAEWEYACRAGSEGEYCFGDDEEQLAQFAWFTQNSDRRTHAVGELRPNAFGLHDLHGNVWEWCEDDWHGSYEGAPSDGRPWVDDPRASSRVNRGGCWLNSARSCRSAFRDRWPPDYRSVDLGFRPARSLP